MSSLEMELEQGEESLGDDILNLSTADIQARTRLLDNEVGHPTRIIVFWTPSLSSYSFPFISNTL